MKNYVLSFVKRGLLVSVLGPIIIAVIYFILGQKGVINTLTVGTVVKGILTSVLLAFIAGGISMIYTVDKLQIAQAALIQSAVLYFDYILIYLWNGWIPATATVIAFFTVTFFVGFFIIWTIIYLIIKHNIEKMNKRLNLQ